MVITDKFVFIHMHKTGGRFIINFLLKFFPDAKIVGYHYPVSLIPTQYKSLPVIGFIRNPWDWYVSFYSFLKKTKPGTEPLFEVISNNRKFNFKVSIINLMSLGSNSEESRKLRQQLVQRLPEIFGTLGYGGYGLTQMDIANMEGYEKGHLTWLFQRMFGSRNVIIGKTENLRDDLLYILGDLGVVVSPEMNNHIINGPKINTSRHVQYNRFYGKELMELIAKKDDYILNRFNYEF